MTAVIILEMAAACAASKPVFVVRLSWRRQRAASPALLLLKHYNVFSFSVC
jgi:hypothetical protein